LELARLLVDLGCKRFAVRPGRGYPGIEDYVVFDPPTTALAHLHVHYQLTLGEKFLKGYRLPWEEYLLGTRVRDAASGVWVTDPHVELLVLVVRAALKLRTRDRFIALTGRRWARGDMLRELLWLIERTEPARLADMARPLVGARASAALLALVAERPPSVRRLRAVRAAATPSLDSYRMFTAAEARGRRWMRELGTGWAIARALMREGHRVSSRTPPQGGLAVACLGADAAVLARDLARWMAHEVAAYFVPAAPGRGPGTQFDRARARGGLVFTDGWGPDRPVPPDLVLRRGTEDRDLPGVPTSTRIIELDPNLPLEEARLAARRAVWEAI
jgi:hypothetical protein